MLLACLSAILPQSSEAAKREAVHKLNYFQSYETEVTGGRPCASRSAWIATM